MASQHPSPALLAARRGLEGIARCELLNDWSWLPGPARWALLVGLRSVGAETSIPNRTDWIILAGDSYPWGSVDIYPAKAGGIAETFPHQHYNAWGVAELPYRTGRLCLAAMDRPRKPWSPASEPYGPNQRLRWYVERAQRWLDLAATDALMAHGDPFELPALPLAPGSSGCLVVSQTMCSIDSFCDGAPRMGRVELVALTPDPEAPLFVRGLTQCIDLHSSATVDGVWGSILSLNLPQTPGIWLRIDGVPSVAPWRFPVNWQELRALVQRQGLDLDGCLSSTLQSMRDAKPQYLLIGFPIPRRIGDAPSRMQWAGIRLPHTCVSGLAGDQPICWMAVETFTPESFGVRGRLATSCASRSLLLIGAGSIGSAIAEMLVRAGLFQLSVMDGDSVQLGNLARHSGLLIDVGVNKANLIAERLSLANPTVKLSAIPEYFPPMMEDDRSRLDAAEVIVDATGSDELLYEVARFPWRREHLFISLSVGLHARRLYCFAAWGRVFPEQAFHELVQPWLQLDMEEFGEQRHSDLEAPGCSGAVFPARIDDTTLLASIAVKTVENLVLSPPAQPQLLVFVQQYEDGHFIGVQRIQRFGNSQQEIVQ